jgi:hypothetical protein
MTLGRISITIPRSLIAAADRRARQLARSRSWVVAEALRRYLADHRDTTDESARQGQVRQPPAPYLAGLGEYRVDQLEADLALTPEQRVRAAEETARLSDLKRPRWRAQRLLVFERYEDYLAWKRFADLVGP